MSEVNIPDYLPDWIRDHIKLYLQDGEAGHYWDAAHGGGEGMLTTLLLTTTGRKSGKSLLLPLIYRPTGDGRGVAWLGHFPFYHRCRNQAGQSAIREYCRSGAGRSPGRLSEKALVGGDHV